MFVAYGAQPLEEGGWRGDVPALTEDGLDDYGGRVTRRRLLRQKKVQLVQRLRDQRRFRHVGRLAKLMPEWERDREHAGLKRTRVSLHDGTVCYLSYHERSDSFRVDGFAPRDGHRTECAAVVRAWAAALQNNGEENGRIYIPCMQIMFWRPVAVRASFSAASTASEPEFQKKNESREGSGMIGRSFLISRRYGSWNAMLH